MKLPTITEQRALIQSKQISAAEVAAECYRRIDELNPKLNAFITVVPQSEIAAQDNAPLYGAVHNQNQHSNHV